MGDHPAAFFADAVLLPLERVGSGYDGGLGMTERFWPSVDSAGERSPVPRPGDLDWMLRLAEDDVEGIDPDLRIIIEGGLMVDLGCWAASRAACIARAAFLFCDNPENLPDHVLDWALWNA